MLRTIVFFIVFYGATVLYVIAASIASFLSERMMHKAIRGWVLVHRFCARHILGIHIRIEGAIPPRQSLFAVKHQSMFETLELLAMIDTPIIVLKKELRRIPAWGWLTERYGGIAIDRAGGAAAMRLLLARSRELLAGGRSVVIFPEGTRVRLGETPPLQAGFAGLYKMFGLPVVPIALDSGRLWPRDSWIKRAGTVTFRFGDPIAPGLSRPEIEAAVHRAINALEPGLGECGEGGSDAARLGLGADRDA